MSDGNESSRSRAIELLVCCIALFLLSCGALVALAYGSIYLANERTGGVPMLQFAALFAGVPVGALVLAILGLSGLLSVRNASIVVAVFAVIFLAGALAHTRYGHEQTLHSAGLDVRVEREYGDPFDYFVVRWRIRGSAWSERQTIGDNLRHKPPFKLEGGGDGVLVIRDRTGTMEERIGPGVPVKGGEQSGGANSRYAFRF